MPRYVYTRASAPMSKLLTAIRADDHEAFEHILETEGLPSSRHAGDLKLLKKALVYGRKGMAQSLLDRGCRGYVRACNGNSPLHLVASRRNCRKLVRRLLDQGARVDQKNRKEETPLHVAFRSADGPLVDIMLEHHLRRSFANEVNRVGLTYLHIAATRPHLNVLRCLVEIGNALVNCKIDIKSNSPYAGFTPLHMAVWYNRPKAAKLLLNYGADLWSRDFHGSTPLHLALEGKNVKMIELLLSYDYKKENYVNDLGLSHFMATCVGSDTSVSLDYLRNPVNSKTALINERVDKYEDQLTYPFKNYTPLHFAAEYGRLETVQLLLDSGARCRTRKANGPMPQTGQVNDDFQQAANLFVSRCLQHNWPPAITHFNYEEEDNETAMDTTSDGDSGYCPDDDKSEEEDDEDYDEDYFDSDVDTDYWEDDINDYIM